MLKKIITSTLISAIVVGLSGCGEVPKPVTKQLQKVKPMVIEFPKVDPITLKEININSLNFSNEIVKLSKYKEYHFSSRYESIRYYHGLKVNKHNNMYSLKYIKRTEGRTGLLRESLASFNFMYKIKDNTITFNYPNNYQHIEGSSLMVTGRPLDKLSNLENDSKNIFSKLDTLYINKRFNLSGETNSKYPEESIYANFKRILGEYSNHNKKQKVFKLKFNDKSIPLLVEIFPYREGSKVKYSATLPYKITQNGSSLTKQDIKDIETKISKIIND